MQRYTELAANGTPFVTATVVDTHGSTPQDAGSKMIVTADGLDFGTVGGGKVEARILEEARQLIIEEQSTRFFDWSLKSDIGMTCGGRVKVFLESVNIATWQIVIFGAGHVTQALAKVLATMPCRVTCIDPRQEWLDRLPANISHRRTDDPPAEVSSIDDDSYVLCMTQGHASDLPVLRQIFQTDRQFPFLGVIGSQAKRAVLEKELTAAGIPAGRIQMHCPIGLPLGTNHPAEIAISIAAQLLEVRDSRSAER